MVWTLHPGTAFAGPIQSHGRPGAVPRKKLAAGRHRPRVHPALCSAAPVKVAGSAGLAENDPARKNEAGKDLIRAIFGTDAIAEDPIP